MSSSELIRTIASESRWGITVAGYCWEMPKPADVPQETFDSVFKSGAPISYAGHWSTPPKHVEVRRLYDEEDVRGLLTPRAYRHRRIMPESMLPMPWIYSDDRPMLEDEHLYDIEPLGAGFE